MKIVATGAHAHQLIRFGLVNCYLLRESDGVTLIDTGIKSNGKHILEAAKSLGVGPIRRILLTHAHGDHVGAVDELVPKLAQHGTDPGIAITRRDARLMQSPPDKALEPGEPQSKLKGSFPGVKARPTHLLSEGELFGSLRVVATPGHTPGHASYFDERDGTLFTGDALICVGGKVHVAGFGPWYFPLPAVATWNKPLALESARKLLNTVGTEIRRYASGHGRLIHGGPALLQQAIAQAEKKR